MNAAPATARLHTFWPAPTKLIKRFAAMFVKLTGQGSLAEPVRLGGKSTNFIHGILNRNSLSVISETEAIKYCAALVKVDLCFELVV